LQNRNVGDIEDFGKYALLRTLFQFGGFKLGVNWCLVEKDDTDQDGSQTDYLNLDAKNPKPKLDREFRAYDEELYQKLQQIVAVNQRSVVEIENRQLLGEKAIFYAETVSAENRTLWHKNGLKALKKADIVFFDPDNGVEIDSCPKTRKNNVKYIYFDELYDYFKRGQSLIIYNHRDRKPDKEYLAHFEDILKYTKQIPCKMFILRLSRNAIRDFFFVVHPDHLDDILQEVNSMLDYDDLGKLFNLVDGFGIYQ
jgi:hypothetical protein